jgi:hypothetical protein
MCENQEKTGCEGDTIPAFSQGENTEGYGRLIYSFFTMDMRVSFIIWPVFMSCQGL